MDLQELLKRAVDDNASDLFIIAGAPVSEKVGTSLVSLSDRLTAVESEGLVRSIYEMAGRGMQAVMSTGDDDFSFAISGLARFRVNVYKQRGSLAAVFRVVAFNIPDYRELGIPEQVMSLSGLRSGLVIVTGTAGSGKSTTQACIIDGINRTRSCHVITLEDPIEYLHKDDKSIVSQREIMLDTKSYVSALRACLRQAPDVIYLGEMRDAEVVRMAMDAAETGHLVLGTMHTKGTANTIGRIVDMFPPESQYQARVQLAEVLNTVVFQELIPMKPKSVAAFEIMKVTSNVKGLIRDGRVHELEASLGQGIEPGMVSMDTAIWQLVKTGRVTVEAADSFLGHSDHIKESLF